MNNFVITKTFFKHKDMQKYTRKVFSTEESPIVDSIIINKENGREVKDIQAGRVPQIDHYFVHAH